MRRRQFIQAGAALSAAAWLDRGDAENAALRVLILGGTGFIGPHFVEALRAGGHKITLFNRGRRNPGSVKGVETLTGDRKGQLDALKNREWDVVIDNSGYVPREVRLTVDLLSKQVPHYIFVSSISAYADLKQPGIDETYELARLKDPTVEEVSNETYGGLKVLCEQVVERTYGPHATIVRPTYIVGPGDTTDRFTYWPVRVARGGDMLAPGTPSDPIQFIDVRDMAQFMRIVVEERISGTFNLCNPPGAVTMGALLETSKRQSRSDARFYWAPSQLLIEEKLVDSNDIPIWAPPQGEWAGVAYVSPQRAIAKGLRFRDLETTVLDTLQWQKQRPPEQQKLRAGLSPEREAALLKRLVIQQ